MSLLEALHPAGASAFLSTGKPAVLAEMFQVLVPGGRIGTSDVVTDDRMTTADRAAASSCTGCIADALSREEYLKGLAAAGFSGARHALSDCPRRQACGEGLGDGD